MTDFSSLLALSDVARDNDCEDECDHKQRRRVAKQVCTKIHSALKCVHDFSESFHSQERERGGPCGQRAKQKVHDRLGHM